MEVAEAVIGHNNPPEPTPFEAVKVNIDDLMTEARNWCDGAAIESQAQADEVGRLMDDLRKAHKAADEARKLEAKPFDDGKAEVQARYNPLLKTADTAVSACKAALSPWLLKLEAEKRAAAEAARIEAEARAKAAEDALRAADASDLTAREDAEAMLMDAKKAEAVAHRAANDKAHAQGGARAVGLRSYWRPTMTNARDALKHYVTDRPEDVRSFLLTLAEADVRDGKRSIPGFEILEEKKVA